MLWLLVMGVNVAKLKRRQVFGALAEHNGPSSKNRVKENIHSRLREGTIMTELR